MLKLFNDKVINTDHIIIAFPSFKAIGREQFESVCVKTIDGKEVQIYPYTMKRFVRAMGDK